MRPEIKLWQIDVFDRIVIRGLRIRRQHLFLNIETGVGIWRDVRWRGGHAA